MLPVEGVGLSFGKQVSVKFTVTPRYQPISKGNYRPSLVTPVKMARLAGIVGLDGQRNGSEANTRQMAYQQAP
jgi:hypothetical protein